MTTSYTQRYMNGDHERVWQELRALGPIPPNLAEDCAAVAAETMRRAGRHIARLAEALTDLGLVPRGTLLTPPTPADLTDLDLLTTQIGALPAAVDACFRYVGGVDFTGDCPALQLGFEDASQYHDLEGWQLPDPLVLPDIAYLRDEWDMYTEAAEAEPELADEGFAFEFAPDDLTKSNISGASLTIALPSSVADPVLYTKDDGTETTLVEELRTSIAWGGMPGWSFGPAHAPAALAGLRVTPDF